MLVAIHLRVTGVRSGFDVVINASLPSSLDVHPRHVGTEPRGGTDYQMFRKPCAWLAAGEGAKWPSAVRRCGFADDAVEEELDFAPAAASVDRRSQDRRAAGPVLRHTG
jgi:uncharacterized phage protein gp47/JayE